MSASKLMAFVSLRGISKSFAETQAVVDLSLDVERGECVTLLGPSGCGKSTTLNLIAGFLTPDRGEILIDDRCVNGLPPGQRNTGMVFQNYALFPHLDVYQNIAFGLKMRKCSATYIADRVAWALDLIQLHGYEKRRVHELSGGQQQRVALARALVIAPAVLLLDEPLSNLDAKLRESMRFELRDIQRQLGITTLFVTHDQEEALTISDRIAVMRDGRLDQVGRPVEVYERPANLFVADFIGHANIVRGVVEQSRPGVATVRTAGGLRMLAACPEKAYEGNGVSILVRPERIRLHDEPTKAVNSFEGVLRTISYLGDRGLCRVQVGDMTINTFIDPREMAKRPLPDGTRIVLEWDVEDALVVHNPRSE